MRPTLMKWNKRNQRHFRLGELIVLALYRNNNMVEEKVKGNLRVCEKIDMWGWMNVELCGFSLSLSLRFSTSNGNFLFHLFVW